MLSDSFRQLKCAPSADLIVVVPVVTCRHTTLIRNRKRHQTYRIALGRVSYVFQPVSQYVVSVVGTLLIPCLIKLAERDVMTFRRSDRRVMTLRRGGHNRLDLPTNPRVSYRCWQDCVVSAWRIDLTENEKCVQNGTGNGRGV